MKATYFNYKVLGNKSHFKYKLYKKTVFRINNILLTF